MPDKHGSRLKIIGHRGAHGLAPENTIAGFSKALEYDIDMIETDVVQTKDNILILQHDSIYLADGSKLWTQRFTLDELKKRVPDLITLEEGVRFVNKRVPLMLDMKKGVDPKRVLAEVRSYLAQGWAPKDFMFNSNRADILQACLDELPEIDRVVQTNWKGILAARWARKFKTEYILLDQRYLWPGYIKMASKRYKLITYTFPWPHEPRFNHHKAHKWHRYGLWGIITDYPDYYAEERIQP